MSAWKKYAATFAFGALLPIVGALYAGGENVAQAGLRLVAIEQGIALAQRHWQFEATPSHEPEVVAQADDEPIRRQPPAKPARKR